MIPEKDVANRSKHGMPLASGAVVLENRIGEVQDERLDYGEVRVNAFGLVDGAAVRLHLHDAQ